MTKIAVSSMTNGESFLEEGVPTACKKLAQLGLFYIELSQHIQVNAQTIPQFEQAVADYNIKICALSTGYNGNFPGRPHNPFAGMKAYSLKDDYEELIAICRRLGCGILRFASIPGRSLYTMDMLKGYMRDVEEMACRLKSDGILLCVHNHAEEFVKLEGRTIFDWSYELAPHLHYEIDALNVQRCGINPVSLIERCGSRTALLHLQDWRIRPAGVGEKEDAYTTIYEYAEVGEGLMDIKGIVDAALRAGTQYIVLEQAAFYGCGPYESLAISVQNLSDMGYQPMFGD